MSSETSKYLKFGGVTVVILVALGYLAYTGVQDSARATTSPSRNCAVWTTAYTRSGLRVAGNVVPGSIKRTGTHVEFTLKELDLTLPVVYTGTEAPPGHF